MQKADKKIKKLQIHTSSEDFPGLRNLTDPMLCNDDDWYRGERLQYEVYKFAFEPIFSSFFKELFAFSEDNFASKFYEIGAFCDPLSRTTSTLKSLGNRLAYAIEAEMRKRFVYDETAALEFLNYCVELKAKLEGREDEGEKTIKGIQAFEIACTILEKRMKNPF